MANTIRLRFMPVEASNPHKRILESIVKSRLSRPFLLLILLPLALPAGTQMNSKSQLNQQGPSGNNSGVVVPGKKPTKIPLLPAAFAGQPRNGVVVTVPTPDGTDASHAAVLKENGLVETNTAQYGDPTEQAYTLEVLRFTDATGAFAVFTFYRDPGAHTEPLGQNAVATAAVTLVQQNNILLIVRRTSGAGQADPQTLRSSVEALLANLPKAGGPEGVLPTLPSLLPADGLQKQTVRYTIGPAGYNGPIPVSSIDFGRDAEAATAVYRLRSGEQGILTLLMLPTPQIAATALKAISALPDASLHVATRRIGPLVGIVSGPSLPQADAQRLANEITYTADVTLDQPQGYTSEVAKAAKLLLGIGYLTIILAVAAVLFALFFGTGRVLIRRMRGKPASSVSDDEFITLKL